VGAGVQRPDRGRPAGEGDGAVEHRLADDTLDLQCPAVADRRGQARAECVELVVQPLLGDLALGDQAAAVPHGSGQGVIDAVGDKPPLALAGQIGHAAQSRSSVLNRREPSWARAAVVSDGANNRTDPGKR
jgi:hypothetical protein